MKKTSCYICLEQVPQGPTPHTFECSRVWLTLLVLCFNFLRRLDCQKQQLWTSFCISWLTWLQFTAQSDIFHRKKQTVGLHGTKMKIEVNELANYEELRDKAFEELSAFHQHIFSALSTDPESYDVVYAGGDRLLRIPGTDIPFNLLKFKERIGLHWHELKFALRYNGVLKCFHTVPNRCNLLGVSYT